MTSKPRAFTQNATGILRKLETQVLVSTNRITFEDANKSDSALYKTAIALWDTGATSSVISLELARCLNLIPRDVVTIVHAAGTQRCDVDIVDVAFHHGMLIADLRVVASNLAGIDMLIGMDIISRGDFAFCNADGYSSFSFRTPAVSHIDFDFGKQQ